MRTPRFLGPMVVVVALAATSSQLDAAGSKTAALDSLLTYSQQHGLFSGAVLVASGDSVVLEKGYGWADREWDVPITPDTKFRLGSVTKQFTAAVILQLVNEGAVSLDSTISSYLPYYRADTGRQVTIHHLLCHQSGIPNLTADPEYPQFSRQPFSTEEIIRERCSGDLEFVPAAEFRYSNSNYVILGGIIEAVTGTPYENALRARIFDPLHMGDTGYDRDDRIIPHRARGYEPAPEGYRNARYIDMSVPHGAGALYSTVRDLYRWDRALYGDGILPQEYRSLMFTPNKGGYGYGWGIRSIPIGDAGDSIQVVRHSGGINGFVSDIVRVPERRQVVVLLSNTVDSKLTDLTSAIVNILYDQTFRMPTLPLSPVLLATTLSEGVDAAVRQYATLKKEQAEVYDFGEDELNRLGYQLLEQQRFEDAIRIFRLNVEAFPEASNTYDSLGEAYKIAGNKKLAIENLKKSLALNPGNTHAEELIKEVEGKE